MKILLVHNFYRSDIPSGENEVFRLEMDMLEQHGHEVETFTRDSDQLRGTAFGGALNGALSTPWNPFMARALRAKVEWFQPDVIHVHNTFPLISPAIFQAIGGRAVRVLTLHNYRLFCPAAIPMRNNQVCTDCMDRRSPLPAVVHGCYRGSRVATLPLAANVFLHRAIGTWKRHVDAFVCLSEFQRNLMVSSGLPAEKVHVKPNFYPTRPDPVPWSRRGNYAVFLGRLSPEKGLVNLLRAWKKWGPDAPHLKLVGSGPLAEQLAAQACDLPVSLVGQVPPDRAVEYIANARLVVLPSEWFEGFPMVLREAFAFGTPSIVSDLGPLPSIVRHGQTGLVFKAGDPDSLLSVMRRAWANPALLETLSNEAYREFKTNYTQESNYRMLMEIYRKSLGGAVLNELNG